LSAWADGILALVTWPASIPVLVPVFDHGRTVGAVVAACRRLGAPHLLVVDDGSRDGSGTAAGGDDLVVSPCNRGKGHALDLGLSRLAAAGWRQALTIDADLQHPPEQALRLALAAAAEPAALWVGVRTMPHAPLASRLGRWVTGAASWAACGQWPADNQCGLRVWPLPAMLALGTRAGRYAYEPESLVRAARAGLTLRELAVEVDYPPDRVSHFAVVRDTVLTAAAMGRLLLRRGA
jgi:glycosyltransferase involved in cell wall biosynthesis